MNGKHRMGLIAVAAMLFTSCGTADNTAEELPADTSAASTAPAASADGTWDMRSTPVSGADTTSTLYQLQIAGDSWTLLFPNRDPITAKVVAAGDSFVVDAGPYKSVRREGMTVSTHAVYRINGDQLTGTSVARYQGAGADSVLNLITSGTRVR